MKKTPVRLAMVGCGAVTEVSHLPAARLVRDALEMVALCDPDLERARALAKRFAIDRCVADVRELESGVDGVVVAVPNHLHAPVGLECLGRGLPVLVEKPLAPTLDQARALVDAADAAGVALQVGLMYRYCEGTRLVKRALEEDWLGTLQNFSLESGAVYDWPITSGFFASKAEAGGGELMDIGSHLLDLLLWWLGEPLAVEYRDDCRGGVEAECSLALTLGHEGAAVSGTVLLSRVRRLSNRVRLVGERLTLEYDLSSVGGLRLWPSAPDPTGVAFVSDFGASQQRSWDEVFADQLKAFARAIRSGEQPAVTGRSSLPSLALIERCYRERQPLEYAWEAASAP